jgi:hypothetical protein
VVVGPEAPRLERFAAQELAGQFKQLFDAEVVIADKVPKEAHHLILIGSPTTNPVVKTAAGEHWPKLTHQGHLLRSVRYDGRRVLLVGGGSPVATLWAVYELGYRFGIRYLLHGDAMPVRRPEMKLDGLDLVLEPNLRIRTWQTLGPSATGAASWGIAEHRRVLGQLAKLKFNQVVLSFQAWQPFMDLEFRGVRKQTPSLWDGGPYRVDGDTAGRAAIRGTRVLENPDFAGKTTYAERTAAGIALARGILEAARQLGMATALTLAPLEISPEFAATVPKARTFHLPSTTWLAPGPDGAFDDPRLRELAVAQIRAYLATYPHIDTLYLSMPAWPGPFPKARAWLEGRTGKAIDPLQLTEEAQGRLAVLAFFQAVLADPGLRKRPSGGPELFLTGIDPALLPFPDKTLPPRVGIVPCIGYPLRDLAARPELLALAPPKVVPTRRVLLMHDRADALLPRMSMTALHAVLGQLRKRGWEGFATEYQMIGDLDPVVHYLARASFDPGLTPEASHDDLITPMCGEGVAGRLTKGFGLIEQATSLMDKHDPGFFWPLPGDVMWEYAQNGAPPAWWKQVNDLYAGAMDEMYRGLTRSAPAGRPLILYYAKRLEFAVEYMNCIQALRLAGQTGDKRKKREQLDKAVEAMYNALSALGEVARDQSDRGVIALLNGYGYRPIKKEYEAQGK